MRAADHASVAAAQVAQWLLEGPAQVADGVHRGGVIGSLNADHPLYVYPEITGYYLQWLAWYAATAGVSASLEHRARAAQQWLRYWLTLERPPTRVYLTHTSNDWRNERRFTFDVAMALRGLGSAVAARLTEADPVVVVGLCRELERTIGDDGVFDACDAPGVPVPDRWSTRRGGFLAKAAGGIIRAAQQLPALRPRVADAARRTFDHALQWAVDTPHDEAHPLLYTLEGIVGLPEHPRTREAMNVVQLQLQMLLDRYAATGRVPERQSDARSVERTDVLAQTIRIANALHVEVEAIAPLRERLAGAVRADGSLPFALNDHASPANVWASMFASQALLTSSSGNAADPRLIV
ncbi:MAG: hypothetical protein M3Z31_06535 [Pseudomonadota bacterium]|nr:hypothetical protein [Pseudomonadota bacterium]